MNKLTKLLAATALTAFAGIASAVPITGSIGFNGAYLLVGGTTLATATGIDITSAHTSGVVTGDFAGIADGTVTNYADFTFDPAGPVASIWSVAGFTFDLNEMNVDFQNASLLALSGSGLISSTDAGLDSTNGKWTFTANATGQNLTWSSSAAPEPAMVLLLATGLIGFGVARKMRKA